MKKLLTVAALAAAISFNPLAHAADSKAPNTPPAVQAALKKYYGDNADPKVWTSFDQNGVKVYQANVGNKAGQSSATVTENGDILYAGQALADSALPAGVKDVAENLFQSPAKDVDQFDRVYYFVNVDAGKGTYELKFDATGKLFDARSYAQTPPLQKGAAETDQTLRHNLAAAAQKDFPGTAANDVHRFGEATGYYVVSLTKNGQPGWVVMNNMGEMFGSRVPVAQTDLPPAVQKTIGQLFKADKIKSVTRGGERYYRIEQQAGSEKIVLMVKANGDVLGVNSGQENLK